MRLCMRCSHRQLLKLASGNSIRGQPLRLLQLVQQGGKRGRLARKQWRPGNASHRTWRSATFAVNRIHLRALSRKQTWIQPLDEPYLESI